MCFLAKVYHPFVFFYTQRSCLVDIVQQPRPERNELLKCFATNKRRICQSNRKFHFGFCFVFFLKSWHRKLDASCSKYSNANSNVCGSVSAFAYVCYRFVYRMRLISSGFHEIRITVLAHTHIYQHIHTSDTIFPFGLIAVCSLHSRSFSFIVVCVLCVCVDGFGWRAEIVIWFSFRLFYPGTFLPALNDFDDIFSLYDAHHGLRYDSTNDMSTEKKTLNNFPIRMKMNAVFPHLKLTV